jgi:hypothetical protein
VYIVLEFCPSVLQSAGLRVSYAVSQTLFMLNVGSSIKDCLCLLLILFSGPFIYLKQKCFTRLYFIITMVLSICQIFILLNNICLPLNHNFDFCRYNYYYCFSYIHLPILFVYMYFLPFFSPYFFFNSLSFCNWHLGSYVST